MIGRIGNWMETFSGKPFWPLDPRPEDIDIIDIASALSKLCRFGGHCQKFYSVAEHSVHITQASSSKLALTALLHDASEAYLCDIIRPIKSSLPNYIEIEERLQRVISERFGTIYPLPAEVKSLDNRILVTEIQQNMAPIPEGFSLDDCFYVMPLFIKLQFWDPEIAKMEFLATFDEVGGKA